MTSLTIRLAQPEDAPAVSQLVHEAYSKWIPVTGSEPMPMLANYPTLIAQNVVYVAAEDGEVVGVLVIWQRHENNSLYIDNLAVRPDHQRTGIGELLLNFAADQARARNLPMLSLMTNEKMEYNQNFYRKHGFAEVRRETISEGRRAVWMHKPVSSDNKE